MATHTNEVVPAFDFTDALKHTPESRVELCVKRVRTRLRSNREWDVFGVPPIPDAGATEKQLRDRESRLGVPLPAKYRAFLRKWRYLVIDDGLRIWGFPHKGDSIGEPWVSSQHRADVPYLVFGDYWGYADGDQLMFDLSVPEQPVVAYLREHGPLFEFFAPSFSLALWRMVEEWEGNR